MNDTPTQHPTFEAPEVAEIAPLFSGYQIDCLIAVGGMGAVYRAVQVSLDREVAIKILPKEFSKDAAFCAGFRAEAKAMARLNHPNLIGVYDSGEVDGMLYIIMEYVPGNSLFEASHGKAIDPSEVIRIISGVCSGLAHAHQHKIIHRDIKPSNILLDLSAQPKIGDFGLAQPAERKIQDGDEIFGTPHYTAPEVCDAPQSVDHRADIFSVGVLLHELLTGRLPADDPRPASLISHCDPRFDAIIRCATAPSPVKRYKSAADITKELRVISLSAGGPRMAHVPASPKAKARSRAAQGGHQAEKSASNLPGIIMLLLAIGLSVFSYQHIKNLGKRSPQEVIQSSPDSADPPAADTPLPSLPKLPDLSGVKPTPKPPISDSDSVPKVPDETPTTPSRPTTPTTSSRPKPVAAAPVFDVPGFLDRAHRIMKERCGPAVFDHRRGIEKNLADFEREVRRYIRDINSTSRQERAKERFKNYMDECNRKGGRLRPNGEDYRLFQDSWDLERIHGEFRDKERSIDQVLRESVRQQSATYVLGIEKQVERLQATNDHGAIKLLKDELGKVSASSDYFIYLMVNRDTLPEEQPKENKSTDRNERTSSRISE